MVGDLPINAQELLDSVAAPSHGAQALFLGVVRDQDGGKAVSAVTYDCFRPLAVREMNAILEEAEARFGVRAAAVHRVGLLKVGEISLGVATACAHREAAFAASRWIVEQIKRRLPVWKKEHYFQGPDVWREGCALG